MRAGQHLEAFSTTFGLVASLVFHAAVFGYIASRTANFDFDFELTLPTEVEFGLTDGMTANARPSSAGPPPSAAVAHGRIGDPAEQPEGLDAGVPDAPTDPETDAGTGTDADTDAGTGADTDTDTDTGTDTGADTDAGTGTESDPDADPQLPVGPSAITGPSRIPPGAQLALRIDVRRIRESPLGPDVTRFLAAVPDWQLLLAGSGIDPVQDLDRLLIASPNLERSKLVLAGRHRRDESFAQNSVQRMARTRGRTATWKRRYGVRTAPWHNRDRTRRTIALLGPRHFTITRPEDLQRVLAVARARELQDAEAEGLVAARGPDALLSMGPEEAISLEIEGVHRFVRGNVRHVPKRLRVAVRETGPDEATVTALATYTSETEAKDAAAYWRRVADFYSEQLVMTLAGFGKTLRRTKLTPKNERVEVAFTLNADQIRFILSYLEGRLQARSPAPARPTQRPRSRDHRPTKKGP